MSTIYINQKRKRSNSNDTDNISEVSTIEDKQNTFISFSNNCLNLKNQEIYDTDLKVESNLDNQVITFQTNEQKNYIIHMNNNKSSIIINDITNNKKEMIKIEQDELYNEFFFSYCFDEVFEMNLLGMFASGETRNIINIYNLDSKELLLSIKNPGEKGTDLIGLIFYNEEFEQTYIISISNNSYLKIIDFDQNIIMKKKIKNNIYHINVFILKKYYINICKESKIISLNFNDLSLNNTFLDNKNKAINYLNNRIINHLNIDYLLGFGMDDNNNISVINLWNFETGELIRSLNFNLLINDILLLNDRFMYIACLEGNILLYDIIKKKIISKYIVNNEGIISIKLVKNKENKMRVISFDYCGKILLWSN